MENVEDFVVDEEGKLVKEKWYKRAWTKTKDVAKDSWQFVKDNKAELIILATIAVPVTSCISKVAKNRKAALDMYRQECRVWDPKNGIYVNLTRPLTGDEKIALAKRGDASVTETLEIFGVIK